MNKFSLSFLVIVIVSLHFQSGQSYGQTKEAAKFISIDFDSGYITEFAGAVSLVGDALQIYEFAEIAHDAIEYRMLSDTEKEKIHYIEVNGMELFFSNPAIYAFKTMIQVARVLGDDLEQIYFDQYLLYPERINQKTLYASNVLNNTSYLGKLRMRIVEWDFPGGGSDGIILLLDRVEMQPNETTAGQTWYGIEKEWIVDLFISVGGINIPKQSVKWNRFTSGNFTLRLNLDSIKDIADVLLDGEIRVGVRVREQGILGLGSATDVGTLHFLDEEIAFPPAAPRLSANSLANTIELSIQAGVPINQIDIYRSEQSDFSIDGLSPIPLECSENRCIDRNVAGGTRYHYKAIASNQAGSSNLSNEVSGMPTIQFVFQELDYSEEMIVNSLQTISGNLYDLDGDTPGDPVSGAQIRARFSDFDWIDLPVNTDQNGYFEFEIRAPALAGSSNLILEGSVGSERVVRHLTADILDQPDKGHNLTLHQIELNERSLLTGGGLSGTLHIENRGHVPENDVLLKFTIRDQDGDEKVDFNIDGPSLGIGQQSTVPFSYVLPQSINEGNYVLYARVMNQDNLDEFPFNSQRIADFYVQEEAFSIPVFRTRLYEFNQLGQSFSLAGGSLTLLDIRENEARFAFKSETTPFLPGDHLERDHWLFGVNELLLFPVRVNSNDTTVTVRAGGVHSATTVVPQDPKIKHGNSARFSIMLQSGREISPESVQFPFGQDAGEFRQWNSKESNEWISGREYHINLEVPPGQTQRDYKSWIRFEDQDFAYFTQRNLEVKPIHDVGFSESLALTAENAVSDEHGIVMDTVAGLFFSVKGHLKNDGDYTEKQQVYFRILKSPGYEYSETQILTVRPGQQVPFAFEWNTLGLDAGTYAYFITAPNAEDENQNNTMIGVVELVEPPELDVVIQDFNEPFRIGDVIPIRIFAGRHQTPLSDASVTVSVEHPDGFVEEKSAVYNQNSNHYEVFLRANLGGNYYITASAERAHYKKGTDSSKAQVLVEVTLSEPYGSARLSEYVFLDVEITPAGDVHAIASDILYDGQVLKMEDFIASDFLNENGTVQTSSQLSHQNNKSVLGVTRLGAGQRGVTNYRKQILGTIALKGIAHGSSNVSMKNFGIMDSKGATMAIVYDDAREATIRRQNALFQLADDGNERVLFQRDTLDIVLTNAYQVQGVLGTIQYDPSRLRVLFLTEGDALKTGNEDETLFLDRADQENGIIEFGVTRVGQNRGVSIGSRRVASIVYEPVSSGSTTVQFNTTGILSANGDILLPSLGSGTEIQIGGTTTTSEKATLAFSPSPAYPDVNHNIELQITLKDAKKVFSLATDIFYDPDIIEFVSMEEGSFLNESGAIQTSLNHYLDAESGLLTLGLTRMGPVGGIDTSEEETLLSLRFRQLENEETTIQFSNAGVMLPDGETRIPLDLIDGEIMELRGATAQYNEGWNIVGIPVDIEPVSFLEYFPEDTKVPYKYEGSYVSSDILEKGSGYWVLLSDELIVDYGFEFLSHVELELQDGWNLVSGISHPVAVQSVHDPDGIIISEWYGYHHSYHVTDYIEPGKGYWILTSDSGTIALGQSHQKQQAPDQTEVASKRFNPEETFYALHFVSGSDTLQTLYFGAELPSEVPYTHYVMPPLPPSGAFDVRLTGTDSRLAEINDPEIAIQQGRFDGEIHLQVFETTPTQAWEVMQLSDDGNTLERRELRDGESFSLYSPDVTHIKLVPIEVQTAHAADLPDQFALEQNYPNPFNPATNIRFSLPQQSQVEINVYNILGMRVSQPVNQVMNVGYHTIVFDASALSSGVYLYELRAGSYREIRSMTVIK